MSHNAVDFQSIAQRALDNSDLLIAEWLPTGKRQGREWVACNPNRQDKNPGSFKVNLDSGQWGDFAADGVKGGDLISLYAFLNRTNQTEAARSIADRFGIADHQPTTSASTSTSTSKESGWKQLSVAPASTPEIPAKPNAVGQWLYHDPQGGVIGCVYRFNKPSKPNQLKPEKYFIPLTLWTKDGKPEWRNEGFEKPRPLFNLHQLTANPESKVVLCEGEKKAIAAGELLKDHIHTCNSGGCNAVNSADLTPLRNRNVLIWPDCDKGGRTWLQAVLAALKKLDCQISVVDTAGLDETIGYDAANAQNDNWSIADVEKRIIQIQDEQQAPSNGEPVLVYYDKKGKASLVAHSVAATALYQFEFKSLLYFEPVIRDWFLYQQSGIFKVTPELMIQQAVYQAIEKHTFNLGFQASYPAGVSSCLRNLAIRQLKSQVGLLCFKNGVLNLRSHELLPHSPDYFFTNQLPFDWLPNAPDPTIIVEWLKEVTGGNNDQVELIRAWFNAVIVGRPDLQRFLEIIGFGGSGKGTLLRLLCAVVGNDSVHSTKIEHLENNRFETAKIFGKKLVVVTDAEKWHGDVSTLKSITGQDPIRFEEKNRQSGDSFTYGGMVLILANQHTASNDYSSGIQRRKITIAFDHVVPAEKRRDLDSEFQPYLPNLIRWVLDMPESEVTDYLRSTTTKVKSLDGVREENLLTTNPIAAWLRSNCIFNPNAITKVGMKLKQTVTTSNGDTAKVSRTEYQNSDVWLYPNYCHWCDQTGRLPISHVVFSRTVVDVAQNMLGKQQVSKITTGKGSMIKGITLSKLGLDEGYSEEQVIENYENESCEDFYKLSNFEKKSAGDFDADLENLNYWEVCESNHHNPHIVNNQQVDSHQTLTNEGLISHSKQTCSLCYHIQPVPGGGKCGKSKQTITAISTHSCDQWLAQGHVRGVA